MGLTGTYDSSLADRLGACGNATLITPDDSNDLASPCRAIYVGTAGNMKVTTARGDTVLFSNLSAGLVHPISCKRIWAATTTAALIIALY